MKAVGGEVHIGEPGIGFGGEAADRRGKGKFTEQLARIGVVGSVGARGEVREVHRAVRRDIVPPPGAAQPQSEGPKAATGIAGKVDAIDIGMARACVHVDIGLGEPRCDAEPPIDAKARIHAAQEPPKIAEAVAALRSPSKRPHAP